MSDPNNNKRRSTHHHYTGPAQGAVGGNNSSSSSSSYKQRNHRRNRQTNRSLSYSAMRRIIQGGNYSSKSYHWLADEKSSIILSMWWGFSQLTDMPPFVIPGGNVADVELKSFYIPAQLILRWMYGKAFYLSCLHESVFVFLCMRFPYWFQI